MPARVDSYVCVHLMMHVTRLTIQDVLYVSEDDVVMVPRKTKDHLVKNR